tara:strand:+ start:2219 stop:2365 length:147 start_codon:yes stop_codon:yes gene_type:complete
LSGQGGRNLYNQNIALAAGSDRVLKLYALAVWSSTADVLRKDRVTALP